MTGGTTSTHGHTTLHTASEAHGTGAGTGARIGACLHGGTAGTTLGTGDGATLGITAAIGEDGMIHGTTGDIGDGTTLGTTQDIGECITHGIRIMPDGTEDSAHIGIMAMAMDMVPASAAADISEAGHGTDRATRPRLIQGYLQTAGQGPQSEEEPEQAAVQAEAQ